MADSLADLQGQLDGLRKARASGVLMVEYISTGGVSRRLRYKTDPQMAAAIGELERRIATLSATRPVRNITVRSTGGWGGWGW